MEIVISQAFGEEKFRTQCLESSNTWGNDARFALFDSSLCIASYAELLCRHGRYIKEQVLWEVIENTAFPLDVYSHLTFECNLHIPLYFVQNV